MTADTVAGRMPGDNGANTMQSNNESRKAGLLRLRHMSEVTEAKAEEMASQRARFERLADPTSAPRVASAFNLFQTPVPLAARLVSLLGKSGRLLEPSAGLGRIYNAIRDTDNASHVTLIDNAPDCCRELYLATAGDHAARLIQDDFLNCDTARLGKFDGVVMNPPFKNGTDINHILHAFSLLEPGGRLVSLCAAGPRQRAAFGGGNWIDLPPGTFKGEGTNVAAAIVILNN